MWALTLQRRWFELLDTDTYAPIEPRDACFTSAPTCDTDLSSRFRARSSELLRNVMTRGVGEAWTRGVGDTVKRWWRRGWELKPRGAHAAERRRSNASTPP